MRRRIRYLILTLEDSLPPKWQAKSRDGLCDVRQLVSDLQAGRMAIESLIPIDRFLNWVAAAAAAVAPMTGGPSEAEA